MIEDIKINLKTVFTISRLIETLVSIGFIFFSIYIFIFTLVDLFLIWYLMIAFLMFLLGITPILLLFNYLSIGLNYRIQVNYDKEIIYIEKDHKTFQQYFSDIDWIEIYTFPNFDRLNFDYHYCKYFFKDGQILIINCLTGIDNYYVPKSIIPVEIEQLFPYINSRKDRKKRTLTDLQIFKNKFRDISKEELLKIVEDKGYCCDARKAAKMILKEKD
ncbi:MAG: hypothetical protein GY756_14310 [bacterium]|nr:hypothetical protein [bacterium]